MTARNLVGVPVRISEDAVAAIDWILADGKDSMIDLSHGPYGAAASSVLKELRIYLEGQSMRGAGSNSPCAALEAVASTVLRSRLRRPCYEETMDEIYLSKRHGHDRNDGRTSKTPVRTPARAWALCKDNQSIHYMDEESRIELVAYIAKRNLR